MYLTKENVKKENAFSAKKTSRADFWKRIVKKRSQKLILGHNFINKNSDDFYVLQLCFFDIF